MAKERLQNAQKSQKDSSGTNSTSPADNKANSKKDQIVYGLLALLTAMIIICAVIGGAFYIFIRNNVYGWAEKYRENIQTIPVLRLALPKPGDPEDPRYLSEDELIKKYNDLRSKRDQLVKELELAKNDIMELQKYKDDWDKLKAENEKAIVDIENQKQELEAYRKEAEEDKTKVDELIARGDKEGFKQFFERVNKETASQLYSELIKEQKASEEAKSFAKLYEKMEPASAAKILERMGEGKMDLIVEILNNMKKDACAQVLAAMDPTFASKATVKLSEVYMKDFKKD